jgi:A118 family predicted phage portal protein
VLEKIKKWFKKGGVKLGMVEELKDITEHPKIAVSKDEVNRIRDNIKHYQSSYDNVQYMNSEGNLKEREFHSLQVPKILARKLSKLVFNEGVEIAINDDKDAHNFIEETFKHTKFRKNFGEELEAAYAIGGLVLRPYYDPGLNQIKISYARAGSFFPLNSSSNDISEMAFTTVTSVAEGNKKVHYTLLEMHTWENGSYVIDNELYRSESRDKLGYKVSLNSLEKYKNLQPRSVLKNFTRPLFVHIKLAGKNNKNLYSPLSLGIIDNSKRQIKDINEKYDQFMWEVKQAERKIIGTEHFFRTSFNRQTGEPKYNFDSDTTAYRMVKSDEPNISEFVPSLRSAEFIETINFLLQIIEIQVGFSAGTLSFDGQSVKTATEIISENSETYSTRSDNVLIVEEAIKELVISIFELAHANNLFTKPSKLDINVDFDDGVFQSQDDKLTFYGRSATLNLMPQQIAMQRIYGISEKEAKEWVGMIAVEQGLSDPAEFENEHDAKLFGGLE